MAEGPLTPEKQLLKIIEDPKSGGGTPANLRRKGLGVLSPKALRGAAAGWFSFFKRLTKKKMALKRLNLKVLNRFLTAAAAMLFLYVAGDAAFSAMSLGTAPNFAWRSGQLTRRRHGGSSNDVASDPLHAGCPLRVINFFRIANAGKADYRARS